MLGDYKNSMNVWILEVSHRYDEDYELVGVFESESDIEVAKNLYLKKKEQVGLLKEGFTFRQKKCVLGEIEY